MPKLPNLDTLYGWGQSNLPAKNVPIQMDIQWYPMFEDDDPATAIAWTHKFSDFISAEVTQTDEHWEFDLTAESGPQTFMSLLQDGEIQLGFVDEMDTNEALKQANIVIVRWLGTDGTDLIEGMVTDHPGRDEPEWG